MAVEDLDNIAEYIALDSEYYANDFVKRIVDQVEHLAQYPEIGRIVPEVNDVQIREIIYHNYRIVYKVNVDDICILIITHGSYDLSSRLDNL